MSACVKAVDLATFISKDGTHGLNIDPNHPFSNLDNNDSRFEVRSDADDQLLLHFQFSEKVRVTGFKIGAPDGDLRPSNVKLFINQTSPSFSDAEQNVPQFEQDLDGEDVSGDKLIPLRVAKFNGIDSITVFFEGSEGEENTAVSSIKFFGQTVQGTNMNELKKSG